MFALTNGSYSPQVHSGVAGSTMRAHSRSLQTARWGLMINMADRRTPEDSGPGPPITHYVTDCHVQLFQDKASKQPQTVSCPPQLFAKLPHWCSPLHSRTWEIRNWGSVNVNDVDTKRHGALTRELWGFHRGVMWRRVAV
jgi:hypothetical protein